MGSLIQIQSSLRSRQDPSKFCSYNVEVIDKPTTPLILSLIHILWNAGNTTQAMEYYQASLKIKPDNPEAMYYVGRLYQNAGDTENANAMFDQVVGLYPDSEYAAKAQNARGY